MNPLPAIYLKLIVLLVIVLACVGIYVAGDVHGDRAGSNRVQVAWDKADKVAQDVRATRIAAANAVTKGLQAQVDEDRRKHAQEDQARDLRLTVALGELRKRPERPSGPGRPSDPPAPGSGPAPVCTGAGLYRDDAEFLVRFADRAQQIRDQRDEYGRQYERARQALEKLQGP